MLLASQVSSRALRGIQSKVKQIKKTKPKRNAFVQKRYLNFDANTIFDKAELFDLNEEEGIPGPGGSFNRVFGDFQGIDEELEPLEVTEALATSEFELHVPKTFRDALGNTRKTLSAFLEFKVWNPPRKIPLNNPARAGTSTAQKKKYYVVVKNVPFFANYDDMMRLLNNSKAPKPEAINRSTDEAIRRKREWILEYDTLEMAQRAHETLSRQRLGVWTVRTSVTNFVQYNKIFKDIPSYYLQMNNIPRNATKADVERSLRHTDASFLIEGCWMILDARGNSRGRAIAKLNREDDATALAILRNNTPWSEADAQPLAEGMPPNLIGFGSLD